MVAFVKSILTRVNSTRVFVQNALQELAVKHVSGDSSNINSIGLGRFSTLGGLKEL